MMAVEKTAPEKDVIDIKEIMRQSYEFSSMIREIVGIHYFVTEVKKMDIDNIIDNHTSSSCNFYLKKDGSNEKEQ